MGLTVHWRFKHKGSEQQVRDILCQLHSKAMDLPFQEVGEVVSFTGKNCNYDRCGPDCNYDGKDDPYRWLKIQASEYVDISKHMSRRIVPTKIIGFEAYPGPGCEPMNIFMAKYPSTIIADGVKHRTKLSGWTGGSFCKTQYANKHGMQNFLRCHLCVIRMLDTAKELGIISEVSDEGDFWEKRDIKALVQEIGEWDEMIAAFAGAFGDAAKTVGGEVVSPITKYSNFEHLEAKGAEMPNLDAFLQKMKQSFKIVANTANSSNS